MYVVERKTSMSGQLPLKGLRVLDLASFIAGPVATTVLGDYGAEVIKIEPPGEGDPQRKLGQAHSIPQHPVNFCWHMTNRNKRAIVLDLKTAGARLFVDAARIFALAHGVAGTNTAQRLHYAGTRMNLGADEISSAVEGFNFIQQQRLRQQVAAPQGACGGANRVNPDALNEVDRRILKEALRQARKLQSRLALDYHL